MQRCLNLGKKKSVTRETFPKQILRGDHGLSGHRWLAGFLSFSWHVVPSTPSRTSTCGCLSWPGTTYTRRQPVSRSRMAEGQFHVIGGIVSPVSDGYGKQGLVLAQHRVAMARLALQSSDWVSVDDWESQQSDWTETVVTMRYHYSRILKQYQESTWKNQAPTSYPHLPSSSGLSLKLLCGADFLDTFRVPGLWLEDHVEELAGRFGLVCISRGEQDPERAVHESDTLSRHRSNIFLVREWIRNESSATKVRRALRRRLSVKYLVPDSVIEYIHKHNLYTEDSEQKYKDVPLRPLTKQTGTPVKILDD
ncbi:hypothetical protein UPYG_G00297680 [Umbra pygmaea]|uniref:Nicotinamide-nucleotide adenylyltransferase n=1 Tax=Umbra pygmaea TaxID=75934 RepID=A0ABD0W5Y0_UMBPY